MSGGSTGTPNIPNNKGVGPDRVQFGTAGDVQRVVPLDAEIEEVAIKVLSDNDDTESRAYIGFSDDVTPQTGFPIAEGEVITITIDTSQQSIYAVTDIVGTELRWIAVA